MKESFESFEEFWSYFKNMIMDMGLLNENEMWEERSENELNFATFPNSYYAEWDISFPTGKFFRLRLTGDKNKEIKEVTNIKLHRNSFTMHNNGNITCIENKEIVREVTESYAAAVAACNDAGHNIYNPFGLMDR